MPRPLPYDILAVETAAAAAALDPATGARATAATLADALAALTPRPRRGARVAVAAETVFSQRVRLPAARTSALSPAELESALFYEVEPFCGVRRADAAIAATPLPGGEWRVSVADRAELAALRDRVRAAHYRFAGAAPLPEAAASVSSAASTPDPAAIQSALFPTDPSAPAVTLLQPPRAGLSARNLALLSVAAAALVLLLSAADFFRLRATAARLRPAVAESGLLASANARVRNEIADATARLRAIEDARARRAAALASLRAGRGRWLALLETLSDGAGGRFVLRSIAPADPDPDPDPAATAPDPSAPPAPSAALVTGLAATPADAADAMARLAAALRPHGWDLRPGTAAETSGGAAAFSFKAVPLPPEAP